MLSYGADTSSLWMRGEAALLRRLPPRWRRPARRLIYLPADVLDSVLGRRPARVPPRGLISVGAGDFRATGDQYLRYLERYCDLRPDSRVLDLGCGIGRMAMPMIDFLDGGTYDGVDVAAADIRWCRRHVSRPHPHLTFHHADIYHREYNPGGRLRTPDYRLPFADGSFDVLIASSLFTHLLAGDVEHYLGEIGRVLAPGGRSFTSYFLLNDESRSLIDAGACGFQFQHPAGVARLHDPDNPEAAVAYEEPWVLELHRAVGLTVSSPLLYGCWCCREQFVSYQDIVVARKEPAPP